MKDWRVVFLCVAISVLLSSCATESVQRPSGTYKVGTPYQINGVWYYPKEDQFYDETGVASWYGSDFHGKKTANGEVYNMAALTAAHRTLPLPTIVRVTNLQNGRSITLRVNDRGPYARGRIIDVSKRAADLLGFQSNGTARVRVQYEGRAKVADPTQSTETDDTLSSSSAAIKAAPLSSVSASELAAPPGAQTAPPRQPPSQAVSTASSQAIPNLSEEEPDGTVKTVQVPSATQLWIQVGAFSTKGNADRLVGKLANVGTAQSSRIVLNGKPLHRVRFGPFAAVQDADQMLDKVISAGQNGAQIIVE